MTTTLSPSPLDAVYDALRLQTEQTKHTTLSLLDYQYTYDGYTHTLTENTTGTDGLSGEFAAYDAAAPKAYTFTSDSLAFRLFCKAIKVPAAVVTQNGVDLATAIVTEHLRRLDKPNVLVLTAEDGASVRAFLPADYLQVTHQEVFGAIRKAIPDATTVKVIGGGWDDAKCAFIVTEPTGVSVTYGSQKDPITAAITLGVHVTCSEVGGKKVTADPVIGINGRFIAPVHAKPGNFYSVKNDDFSADELRSLIRTAMLIGKAALVETIQAESNAPVMDDPAIREWITDLCRYKGASNSLITKLEKSVDSGDGEPVSLTPMTPFELSLQLLFLAQSLDKPLTLGLERALGLKLNLTLD